MFFRRFGFRNPNPTALQAVNIGYKAFRSRAHELAAVANRNGHRIGRKEPLLFGRIYGNGAGTVSRRFKYLKREIADQAYAIALLKGARQVYGFKIERYALELHGPPHDFYGLAAEFAHITHGFFHGVQFSSLFGCQHLYVGGSVFAGTARHHNGHKPLAIGLLENRPSHRQHRFATEAVDVRSRPDV